MSGLAVHTLTRVGGLYYAGTTQGVYWTFNTGQSWAVANGGLPACSVRALAADAGDSHILYAATATAGVYKSVDGGYSWVATGNE
jgi:ligand-binding sensor domain-containing protein